MECETHYGQDPGTLAEQESHMWERKVSDPADTEAYHWLFHRHFGLVVRTMRCFLRKGLPPRVTRTDLISDGSVGLCEAIANFQPETGNAFPTFALWRIRGEIVDSLRRIDPLARTMRRRVTRLQRARRELSQELQRAPNPQELEEYLGLDAKEFEDYCLLEHFAQPADIDATLSHQGDRSIVYAEALETSDPSPDVPFYERNLEFWRVMLRGLNTRERLLLILHYYEGQDLRDIAEQFGLTSGAITLQHRQILDRLSKRCREHCGRNDELDAIFHQQALNPQS